LGLITPISETMINFLILLGSSNGRSIITIDRILARAMTGLTYIDQHEVTFSTSASDILTCVPSFSQFVQANAGIRN